MVDSSSCSSPGRVKDTEGTSYWSRVHLVLQNAQDTRICHFGLQTPLASDFYFAFFSVQRIKYRIVKTLHSRTDRHSRRKARRKYDYGPNGMGRD